MNLRQLWPWKRKKRFNHLMHMDEIVAVPLAQGFLLRMKGWALVGERIPATRVYARLGDHLAEGVRTYRSDVIRVGGGRPAENQLAGFLIETRVPGPKVEVAVSARNPEGEEGVIWRKKLSLRDHVPAETDPSNRFTTFSFVNALPHRECAPPRKGLRRGELSLDWIIPDFSRGAGGHAAIFRLIEGFEREGNRCRIWIVPASRHGSPDRVREVVSKSFVPVRAEVGFLEPGDIDQVRGDLGFATDRWTAYYLRAASGLSRRFYLVQDFEPLFYPAGSAFLLAENTYRFGFSPITSSPWLSERMRDYTDKPSIEFNYGVDHRVYHPSPGAPGPATKPLTIVFYARAETSRRAVEVGMLALELLAQKRDDFEVRFFGEQLGGLPLPFAYEDRGVLSAGELAELYRESTVGMVFSATNHAIIPKEMMACGLPVVELDGPNTRSVYPEDTLCFVPPDPQTIASKLNDLLDNANLRTDYSRRGIDFAKRFHWDREVAKVLSGVYQELNL